MRKPTAQQPESRQQRGRRSIWQGLFAAGALLVVLIAVLSLQERRNPTRGQRSVNVPDRLAHSANVDRAHRLHRRSNPASMRDSTAEEIVAAKVSQFSRNRREIVHALARRAKIDVPGEVERFFDAVEGGNWEEIAAAFKVIDGGDSSASSGSSRPPGVQELWPAILDTYGVAGQAHLWPPQKLLDYGNAVLGSLRPGMVYIGGTDPGRWIPELLIETMDGERHIVITQNGLADKRYADYVDFLYGDRLSTFAEADSDRAFQEYVGDAQKRFQHDQEFPDEPKQIRPGEKISMIDGRIQVSGQVAVMAINEKLLQTLLEKNPDLSFALEESFPLKGTYANAAPLGPIMELRAREGEAAWPADRAAQSIDYWRDRTQALLADAEASASPETLKTYSHDANSHANLLAAHQYTAEAEEAYRLSSQLWPGNPEPVGGLAAILASTGRAEEGRQLLEDFARKNPGQRDAAEQIQASFWVTAEKQPAAR